MDRDLKIKIAVSLVAVAGFCALLYGSRERAFNGANDFMPLYVAGQLAGTSQLYEIQPYIKFQVDQFGGFSESLRFTRPPFYAVLLAPFRVFDYPAAYAAWNVLRLGAVAAFILLWPVTGGKADTLMLACLSIPIYMAFMAGQDAILLMPLIAAAVRYEQKRPWLTGIAFTLCAIKFHLFMLVPILLVCQRRWDIMKCVVVGVGGLLLLCFVGGGLSWPLDYYGTLTDGRVHPGAEHMPNIHGIGLPLPAEATLCLVTFALACFVFFRLSFDLGLAVALIGGLLLSYHSYVMDCVVLLPAMMALLMRSEWEWLRIGAAVFLSPVPVLLQLSGPPKSYVMAIGLVALMAGVAARTYGATPADTLRPVKIES